MNISYICFTILICCVLNFFLILINKRNISNDLHNDIQKIHIGSISRHGGFSILLSTFIIFFLTDIDVLSTFFLFSSSIFILGFFEDLTNRLKPTFRLFSILFISFSCILLLFDSLPVIDLPLASILKNYYFLEISFFAIAITSITNGMNIIDGSNGIVSFVSISIIFSLMILLSHYPDIILRDSLILLLSGILGFLLFNYPFGKIFLGDGGAYLLGFILSLFIIYYFSKQPQILSWNAVLMLFYPAIEVLFSYVRKISTNKSPFKPDSFHLHLLLFNYLFNKFKNIKKANNFVALVLSPFWAIPPLSIYLFYDNLYFILASIFILVVLYLLMYLCLLPKK